MVKLAPPYRVLIVDDSASVREALRFAFEGESDMEVIGEASSGADALRLAALCTPDIILLDYWLPDATGVSLLPLLRACAPQARTILLTVETAAQVRTQALAQGAAVYLHKLTSPSNLFANLRRLAMQE